MADTQKPKWLTASQEVAVIVVGVLIALGADAAWDNRQELVLEEFYLTSIMAEVGPAIAVMDSTIAAATDFQRRSDEFLAVLETGGAEPDSQNRASLRLQPMLMTLGALENLVETGDLRLVRDERLRRILMTEHTVLNNQRRIHDQLDANFWINFNNYLVAATRVRSEHGLRSGEPIPVALIQENPTVHVAWAQQQAYFRNVLFGLSNVRESLGRLDGALTERLSP